MSGTSTGNEPKVPLGVALIMIGIVLLFFSAITWFVFPEKLPAQLQPASVPENLLNNSSSSKTSLLPNMAGGITILATSTPNVLKIEHKPSHIVIPNIAVDAKIHAVGLQTIEINGEEYTQWQVPDAPIVGWHSATAPLGEPGNTVLNGHHNVYGEIFRDLVNLSIGDEIIIYDESGIPYMYTVTITERFLEKDQPVEVRLENAKWIEPTNDERVTLITCWPYSTNSHRVVVVAEPVSDRQETASN